MVEVFFNIFTFVLSYFIIISFVAYILINRKSKIKWEYGTCNGLKARRNKTTGVVQFILWKAGEQNHKKHFWHNFDKSWYKEFKNEKR